MDSIKAVWKAVKAAIKKAFGYKAICFSNGGREFVSYHWTYREALSRVMGNSRICWAADVVDSWTGETLFSVTREIV